MEIAYLMRMGLWSWRMKCLMQCSTWVVQMTTLWMENFSDFVLLGTANKVNFGVVCLVFWYWRLVYKQQD